MRRRNELALLPKLPLLITESADEFDALREAFEQEIKPRGIIEQMYMGVAVRAHRAGISTSGRGLQAYRAMATLGRKSTG